MIERRGGPRLLLESGQAVGSGGKRSRQDFDGNLASEPGFSRTIDFAHPPSAKEGDDFLRSKARASAQQHVGTWETADYKVKRLERRATIDISKAVWRRLHGRRDQSSLRSLGL